MSFNLRGFTASSTIKRRMQTEKNTILFIITTDSKFMLLSSASAVSRHCVCAPLRILAKFTSHFVRTTHALGLKYTERRLKFVNGETQTQDYSVLDHKRFCLPRIEENIFKKTDGI